MHIILESGDHADATPVGPDLLVRGCVGGYRPRLIPADCLWEHARLGTERRHGERRQGERRAYRQTAGRRIRSLRREDVLTLGDDLELARLTLELQARRRAMV